MVIAIYIIGVALGLSLLSAAQRLGEAIRSGISEAADTVSEAIHDAASPKQLPRPSRTILAEAGTRMAYICRTEDKTLEIRYTPVLALVEMYNAGTWLPLAVLNGEPRVYDCFVERVLLPGQSLSELELVTMKERYSAENVIEVQSAPNRA